MSTQTQTSSSAFLDRSHIPPVLPRPHFLRFLLILLLPPVLFYLAAVPLVRVAGFGYENWGLSKWGPVLNFPFQAEHLDADVVVFGDSTAFLGIDPRLVNRELKIKTLVLPNTIGSLPVINDLALERYLEHNKAPRLLVFYFDSWNLDYERNNQKHLYFEGEEMLLRHGTWPEIETYLRHYPAEALAFPLQLNSEVGWSSLKQSIHAHRAVDVVNTLGHRDYTDPVPPMSDTCTIPEKYLAQTGIRSVQALVAKYRARGMDVVVYLAPMPACSNAARITNRSFTALAEDGPALLPGHLFADDGFYGHLRPEAVPDASHLFAEALRSRADMAAAFPVALSARAPNPVPKPGEHP